MGTVKKFGPFVLDRMIGRGGMGAVYRARDENSQQIVAVKALLLPLERERERFEAEISTLRLLRHENIVKLFGFGQEDGILYYAMEFVDGPSLSTLLRRGRRFTWEETVYIGAKICNALKHAHDRGVIHRDIKPANILLVSNGVVKVSDYGVAQYFGASRLTNANQVVGTIEFMAPEQAQASAITPKTDIYALGALMYSLLTGRPPYVAKTLPELLKKFREGLPEPIRASRPETPKVVDDVVLGLLQIQPEKRPADARLVGRRLEALLYTSPSVVDGNPFLGVRFPTYGPAESAPQDVVSTTPVSDSRVDLENDVTTMCKDSEDDFKPNEDAAEPVMDFPYRPIVDELDENFDFQSPFDKTTERATLAEGADQSSRPEEQRDDFFVGPGRDPDAAGASDCETSTGEQSAAGEASEVSEASSRHENEEDRLTTASAAEDGATVRDAVRDATIGTAEDARDERPRERFAVRPTTESSGEESASARSTEFEVGYDSSELTGDSDVENAVTAAAEAADAAALVDSATLLDVSEKDVAEKKAEKPRAKASSRLRNAAAPTVVDRTTGGRTRRRAFPEPQGPSTLFPSRNVPFEELDKAAEDIKATPVEKFRKSSFIPVDEAELGELPAVDAEPEKSLFVRFRMLWFFLSLAAIVGGLVTTFRTPSADRLYSRIDRTFSRSTAKRFDVTLRRSEKEMRRFVDLYPNDPRSEKLEYFLCEIQIEELDQRLERQALNPGRDAPLQPIVRAYLDARRSAQQNWEEGSEKLAAFIDLFASDALLAEFDANDSLAEGVETMEDGDDSDGRENRKNKGKDGATLRSLVVQNRWKLWKADMPAVKSLPDQLVVIAKRRLLSIEAEIKTTRRADVALLNDRLIKAETLSKDEPERAASIRRAAETLYGRYGWAKNALLSPPQSPDASSAPTAVPPSPPDLAESIRADVVDADEDATPAAENADEADVDDDKIKILFDAPEPDVEEEDAVDVDSAAGESAALPATDATVGE